MYLIIKKRENKHTEREENKMTRFEKTMAIINAWANIKEDTAEAKEAKRVLHMVHMDYITGKYVSDDTFNKCIALASEYAE